jgi:hypothetical protein
MVSGFIERLPDIRKNGQAPAADGRYASIVNLLFGRLAWLVGVAILVLAANVALSFAYMVVYGHLIDPGHDEQYYRDHINVAAPYCSIVAGMPLMFLAGWWVAGWWQAHFAVKAALAVWLAYALIDLAALVAAGLTTRIAVLFAVSFLTKLAAVYLGARVRLA